ncbi:hypothetical protein KY290_022737 [Solanum tuberosum]|uniref:Uncharacterized protein n=1 Tax=Solanum tuberosum TaxID=4113 RepID=A0ABQ7V585_SOLTU|nr:hypothetical protein KY290_022737 [Solanum tuberosum]
MSYFGDEFPPPLSLIAIFAIIIVYMLICYLVLDLIDQPQGDPNDDMDVVRDSGLSLEELQEINCFYLKGQNCAEVFQLVTICFMLNVSILG